MTDATLPTDPTPTDPGEQDEKIEALPLGPGPRPVTTEQFLDLVRRAIRRQVPEGVTGTITGRLDGPDIDDFEASFSGHLDQEQATWSAGHPVEPVTAEPAIARRASLQMADFDVEGVPVDFTAEAFDWPFEWLTDADGAVWLRPGREPARVKFRGRTRLKEAVAVVHRFAAEALAEAAGIRLRKLNLELIQHGPTDVTAKLSGRISKFLLTAAATALVRVRIDHEMVAEVVSLEVHSLNPVVKLAWLLAGKEVRAYRGRKLPLTELTGVTVRDLQLETGKYVGITVEVAPTGT